MVIFTGKITTYEGMVFGVLESGDSVIVANSIVDAKALIGCECEYKKVSKTNEPLRFKVIAWQL